MRFRTWPVVALALFGLIALIGISLLAARREAEQAYARLDDLNARHAAVEARLRGLRADVQLSGILIRDVLLDFEGEAAASRARLQALQADAARLIAELEPLVRAADPGHFDRLRREVERYWRLNEPLFQQPPGAGRYGFLRREIAPQRDAVMTISAEIERIHNASLEAERDAVASRASELRKYLAATLAASLALGLVVAVAAVARIRVLERRSGQEQARSEEAGQEMRRLSHQLRHTQEDERKRLSRELHDEVGQMLTALRLEIGRLERAHAVGSPGFAAVAAESKALLDRMMRAVRDLAMGLRPSMLDDLGLEPALAWQAREFSKRLGVPVALQVEGNLEQLPDAHRTCVYRVVQEALTNCARHARATAVTVAVRGRRDHIELLVQDNGVGMPEDAARRGLGLIGIAERIGEMHGTVSLEPDAGGGTRLQAIVPIQASNRPEETRVASTAG